MGILIRAARERKGLSQSDLARLLDVKPQSVQAWEAGRNHPKTARLQQIAQTLGVSPELFMGGQPSVAEDPASYAATGPDECEVAMFRSILSEMTPASRKLLLQLARQLASKSDAQ